MEWSVSESQQSLLGFLTEDPQLKNLFGSAETDSTFYTVYELNVPAKDQLLEGMVEFWRRLLTDGRKHCLGKWEILLFEFWTDSGTFKGFYTTRDREHDEPGVFILSSEQIEEDYYSLPSSADGGEFETAHKEFEKRYWDLLQQAAQIDPIPRLIASWRKEREMPIWGTYCYYEDHMFKMAP